MGRMDSSANLHWVGYVWVALCGVEIFVDTHQTDLCLNISSQLSSSLMSSKGV